MDFNSMFGRLPLNGQQQMGQLPPMGGQTSGLQMGQLPPMGGGQQQMQPLGGGQMQMQPLGMGQMPMNTGVAGPQQPPMPSWMEQQPQTLGQGFLNRPAQMQPFNMQQPPQRFNMGAMMPQLMSAMGHGGAFGRFGPMLGNEYGAAFHRRGF